MVGSDIGGANFLYFAVTTAICDYLGSASLTTDAAGEVVSKQRYYPFGTVREQEGESPAERTPLQISASPGNGWTTAAVHEWRHEYTNGGRAHLCIRVLIRGRQSRRGWGFVLCILGCPM